MSRIHEALKRAEEERENGVAAVSAPALRVEESRSEFASSGPRVSEDDRSLKADSQSVSEPGDVDDGFLTALPQQEWKPDLKRMLFMDRSRHYDPGMEEFRTLRSRLYQLKEKTKSLRTIMVASALPGEGKTFVSTNLAQALVRQHGRRVLLIDADVRKPHMHQSLGAAEAPGLVDYLSGSLNQESVVQRGPLDNLFFIPGGKAVSNPSELIANGRLKALLENMRNLFHWIIVDSSPVVPVSDATLVASACDGVLLVLQADTTPVTIAQKARQEFKNIPILGVVLNRSKESPAESSYYYSYGRNRTFEQNS